MGKKTMRRDEGFMENKACHRGKLGVSKLFVFFVHAVCSHTLARHSSRTGSSKTMNRETHRHTICP